jgi:hypothetical protein
MSKNWVWEHFFTDNLFFRNDNYHKNAWCIACLNHHKELLRQSDVVSAAIGGTNSNRTDAEREAQGGYYLLIFLYGK